MKYSNFGEHFLFLVKGQEVFLMNLNNYKLWESNITSLKNSEKENISMKDRFKTVPPCKLVQGETYRDKEICGNYSSFSQFLLLDSSYYGYTPLEFSDECIDN